MDIKMNAIIMIIELPRIIYYRSLLYGFTDLLSMYGNIFIYLFVFFISWKYNNSKK